MSLFRWLLAGCAVASLVLLGWVIRRVRRSAHEVQFDTAMRNFRSRREYLEAKFFDLAAQSGKPRGLEWTRCEFDDEVAYARDRQSGELAALVAVTIGFSAIEGGGMDDVEAVGNLRAATAVFVFTEGRWRPTDRVIFNLNPTEAISHYSAKLEIVTQKTASHA